MNAGAMRKGCPSYRSPKSRRFRLPSSHRHALRLAAASSTRRTVILAGAGLLLMALLSFIPAPAQAAQTGQAARRAAPPAIDLPRGEGRVVRFDTPVASVFVADVAVADIQLVSPRAAYVYGKQVGATQLIALDGNDREVAQLPVRIGTGASRGGAAVREQPNGKRVTARGRVDSLDAALDVQSALSGHADQGVLPVNATTLADLPQINLRVRFAEVSREELLRYGVNWSALLSRSSFSFGLSTGGPLSNVAAGAGNFVVGGFQSGSASIDVLLQALQTNGVLEVLAEPNITTVTGRTASFLAGGEIPVPVPVNRDLVGIDYKPYGVSLVFTPTLLPNDRISLQVRPEVSTLSATGVVEFGDMQIPAFQVRRADTQVEVGSGQTFAIAGLFQRSSASDVQKLPMLGDIPILGQLFRSQRFLRNETELVILITPYLVRPPAGGTAATPLDGALENPARLLADGPMGLRHASDFGFYVR